MSAPADVTGRFVPCLNPATLTGLPLPEFLALAAGAGFPTVEVSVQQAQSRGIARLRDSAPRCSSARRRRANPVTVTSLM